MAEAAGTLHISTRDFAELSTLVKEKFGLVLGEGKQQLVSTRLSKRLRELKYANFKDYYRHVTSDESGAALEDMVDALTTKFTSFFREEAHFRFLREQVLREHARYSPIRIWSAACATGEEPYSIAITVLEALGTSALSAVRIVASDVAPRALSRASEGVYQKDQVAAMPKQLLRKYFLKGSDKWEGWYRVKPMVRELVEFRQVNLMDALPSQAPFSLIFCRNVMIYFDTSGQEHAVNQLTQFLEPDGYLFIGHAEGLTGVRHSLRYVQPAIYKRTHGKERG